MAHLGHSYGERAALAWRTPHGLNARAFDDWLIVDDELPALRGTYNIANTNSKKITTQVDIELRLSDGRSICEHYAGLGDDERQASGQGLFKFCCGAFHVYLSAYWDHHEADQVEIETWEIDGVRWNAYISNMINQASAGAAAGPPTTTSRLFRLRSVHCRSKRRTIGCHSMVQT